MMPGGGEGGYGDGTMVETGPQTDLSGVNVAGPTGPGWVVELAGYHYHNDPKDRLNYGPLHVKNTLLKQLKEGFVDVPKGPGQPPERFTMKELGIGYAILAHSARPRKELIPNPNYVMPTLTPGAVPGTAPGLGGAIPGAMPVPGAMVGENGVPIQEDPNNPTAFPVIRYEFVVQFVWQENPLVVRIDKREKARIAAEEAAKAAAEAAAAGGAAPAEGGAPPAPPAEPAAPAAEEGMIPANDPGLLPPEEAPAPAAPAAGPAAVAPGGAALPPGPAGVAPAVPPPAATTPATPEAP
jgi:type IV pilus assembly protein PilM